MAIREALAKLDRGEPNHHDRDRLLARNGRWGTRGACPRDDDGRAEPESCEYTGRSDHNHARPNHEAWSELEAIERSAKALANCQIGYLRSVTPSAEAEAAHALVHAIAKEAKKGDAATSAV